MAWHGIGPVLIAIGVLTVYYASTNPSDYSPGQPLSNVFSTSLAIAAIGIVVLLLGIALTWRRA